MLWVLLAILLIGGGAAVVNDLWYGGQLFDSAGAVRGAALSSLVLFIGRGLLLRSRSGRWMSDALIWAAIILAAMLVYSRLRA